MTHCARLATAGTLLSLALACLVGLAVLDSAQAAVQVSTSATPEASPTPGPVAPAIAYFTCDPCAVEPGGAATLRWDLSGATAAYLDGQGVTAPGRSVVHPDQTTTYRLVAVGQAGQSEKTVTVQVRGLPTIHYFTCLPCEIVRGEQSTLSWDLSGATAAYLDGYGVAAPGSSLVAPGQTTTYRLLAVSDRGSVERLVTVTVKEGGDPETVGEALRQAGYDVRWVGPLRLAAGGETMGVIVSVAEQGLGSQEVAQQVFHGFSALYRNYPGHSLTLGLYDGGRYIVFVSAESRLFEEFLRGALDGQAFWRAVTWHVWDDWAGRWRDIPPRDLIGKDFAAKSFGF